MQAVQRSNRELWLAFATIVIVTFLYLVVVAALSQIPPASQLFGHALGILGFILMLLTETPCIHCVSAAAGLAGGACRIG
jgi:hypothetical protein